MPMDFRQFSRNNTFVSIPGKLSEIHLRAWLFSNPCGKVLISVGISWSPDLGVQPKQQKSRIWETLNFSACLVSNTDIKKSSKKIVEKGEKKIMCQVSHVRCQVSHVRCEVWGVRSQVSHVPCYVSLVTQSKNIKGRSNPLEFIKFSVTEK